MVPKPGFRRRAIFKRYDLLAWFVIYDSVQKTKGIESRKTSKWLE
jgi:hypothetical protein